MLIIIHVGLEESSDSRINKKVTQKRNCNELFPCYSLVGNANAVPLNHSKVNMEYNSLEVKQENLNILEII